MESAELLKRLKAEVRKDFHHVPDGWKTAEQWASEWGLKRAQAAKLLSAGVASGIIEHTTFRIPCLVRHSYPTPHYRQKPAPSTSP